MPRENIPVFAFNAGILSPLLDGRIDLPWYKDGAERLENFVVTPQGPLIHRPGTEFKAALADESKRAVLRPFVFGIIDGVPQAYMLSIEQARLRFFTAGAPIVVAETDAAIANGDFTTNTTGWDDISSGGGAAVQHDAARGMLVLHGVAGQTAIAEQDVATSRLGQTHVLLFDVLGAPGDTVALRIGTASGGSQVLADTAKRDGSHAVPFTPAASPVYIQFRNATAKDLRIDNVRLVASGAAVSAPLEVATPWMSEAAVRATKVTQSNDVLYIASPGHHLRELRRFGALEWSLVRAEFKDGPYLSENVSATTLQPGAASGLAVTVTASAVAGINGGKGFLAGDVGRLLTINHGGTWGYGVIVELTDTTHVKIDVKKPFNATTAQAAWKLGLYSDTTGHPAALTFHEQRLILGGAAGKRGGFDGTAQGGFGDVLDFTPGTDEDDAIAATIDANQVNPIYWLMSGRVLLVGTAGAEARVGDLSSNESLKPGLMPTRPAAQHGSHNLQPVQTANAVLFVQRDGMVIRELTYKYAEDGYVSPDVTERAEHLFDGGIEELAFQQTPWSALWAIDSAGALLGFTYRRPEQVTAWHPHPIGGGGAVESIATIPGGFAAPDELWLIVRRTIAGTTRRYVERLARPWGRTAPLADAFFVDAGVSYAGPPTASLGNAGHLTGALVAVLADGFYSTQTVANGNIVLDTPASTIHVGFARRALYGSNRVAPLFDLGAALAGKQQIDGLALNLYRTVGGQIGRAESALDAVPQRISVLDAPPALFTGIVDLPFNGEVSDEARVLVVQDLPYPMTLRSMKISIDTTRGD